MSFTVMMDGSLDIPAHLIQAYNIPVVAPLVLLDGKELLSGVDITIEEFFKYQRTATVLPKTSQPAPGQFIAAFEEALKKHDRVLYIGVSQGLSGTLNSARQAATNFPADKIVIHDTLTIAAEGGLQVIAAARIQADGGTLEEAVASAKRTQAVSHMYFTVDDLTYLIKGGRIGRVAGAIGGFLNIKPIITVDKSDGKFQPHSRIRSFKAVMNKLVDLSTEVVGRGKKGRFVVLYGDMKSEAAEMAAALKEACDPVFLEIGTLPPTLAAHTGPKALGIVVAPGDWD